VTLRCTERSDGLEISVEDNGRGVQWDRLAAALQARGLPSGTREELVAGLFADGVSSRSEVSETSGRGVGMGAVKEAVLARGGQVRVESEAGKGTRFVFWFPKAVAIAA
jgi:two-component system chemotaxis sensor kinase CheA